MKGTQDSIGAYYHGARCTVVYVAALGNTLRHDPNLQLKKCGCAAASPDRSLRRERRTCSSLTRNDLQCIRQSCIRLVRRYHTDARNEDGLLVQSRTRFAQVMIS
jgi:hypothetical protein